MEVVRPVTISKSGEDANERRKKKEGRKADDSQSNHQTISSSWSDEAAVEFNNSLTEITPDIARLLEILKRQIEPLRQKLEQADIQINSLKDKLKKHIFLPIPNRREFEREVGYLLNHLDDLSTPPYLLILYCYGLELVRRDLGRNAMDDGLQHIVQTIQSVLMRNDIFASLGGTDFAVVFTSANAIDLENRINIIRNTLVQNPFLRKGKKYELKTKVGVAKLEKDIGVKELFLCADESLVADELQ